MQLLATSQHKVTVQWRLKWYWHNQPQMTQLTLQIIKWNIDESLLVTRKK